MIKRLHLIINPASGQDVPVLAILNRALQNTGIEWSASVTSKPEDADEFAQAALETQADAIAVYGGDGTVTQVARVLAGTGVPLIPLPGGTANIFAKELELPTDLETSLKIFQKSSLQRIKVDMATFNSQKMLLRVNVGFLAEMIQHADQEQKNKFGKLTYAITALETLVEAESKQFVLELGNTTVQTEGIAMMVANVTNIGLPGVSLIPHSSFEDGLLDVIIITAKDIPSLVSLAKGTFSQSHSPALQHWQVPKVRVTLPRSETILLDDEPLTTQSFEVNILPKALDILL